MNKTTVQVLIDLNNAFYREYGSSFSATRRTAWPGWERVASHLEPGKLLDVACGNLRFERFLESHGAPFEFTCLDSYLGLAEDDLGATLVECDVIGALMEGEGFPDARSSAVDSVVSFGFMHHVPTTGLREKLVQEMLACVRPGGTVALSFWCFADDGGLRSRAEETTAAGCAVLDLGLDPGDYLVGWQGKQDVRRYCHSFIAEEVDGLARSVDDLAETACRFRSDGRTGRMNDYLVLRRR